MPIYRQGKHLYWAPWKGCTSMTTAPPAASGQEQTVIIDGYRPKAAAESTAWFSETLVSWGLLRASNQRQPLQVFRYSSDDQHDICSSKTRAARQPSSVELSFAGVPLDRKKITRVNLLPLANEMRAWMLQRGKLPLVPSPINALKRNGVWAEDGDFKLIPGVEFALDALEPM